MANLQIEIDWFADKVTLAAQQALNLEGLAFRIEERTKDNIVSNDQIDTGFMLNSTYVVSSKFDTFVGGTRPGGRSGSTAGMGPKVTVPDDDTYAIVVGAEYAIYQEQSQSFLYKALTQAAAEVQGQVGTL